eukprot:RCo044021
MQEGTSGNPESTAGCLEDSTNEVGASPAMASKGISEMPPESQPTPNDAVVFTADAPSPDSASSAPVQSAPPKSTRPPPDYSHLSEEDARVERILDMLYLSEEEEEEEE